MPLLTTRGLGLLILAFAVSSILPAPSAAQYFGRQKVNYENFDWQILQTSKFKVYFYPEEEEVARDAARMAERWYARLSAAFQHEFDEKPLILYADHPDFQQTNVIGGLLGQGTGGVTEGLRNRVIMPFTGVYADNDHVLGHEMVHVFQYDLASSPTGGGLAGMGRLPLYLIEGMAEYLSLGREDPHTAMWLRDAALRGELPTLAQLNNPRFFPYRYGQAMWAHIGGTYGDRAVTEIFRVATRQGFEAALLRVIGTSPQQLSEEWITEIRSTYLPVVEGRQRAQDVGTPVLFDDDLGAMNLSPAASPDGNYVAYFGRRNVFTIDLLVADSRTGEIVKTLTSPNRNEHFDAISFINSAGTWSPDGRQFAFIVFKGGDNQISLLDVGSGNTVNTFDLDEVGAIHHIAWSPDGRSIAFSGMSGGKGNLYVLDVPSGDVRQLTDDRYAALMPAWSPDGRTIAFVTDRAGTDFDRLIFGEMGIALYDLASGNIEELDIFDGAKHINPQFSPDGRNLYFVANREGFSDVYRAEIDPATGRAGDIYQITRLATGVSGITSLSPALTVAANTGRLLFSAFENSGYNIYGLEPDEARGTLVAERSADIGIAGLLPPIDAEGSGMIAGYLEDDQTGLPANGAFEVKEYSSEFGLEYLGPPSVGVGVSSFGTGINGGVAAFFGDMLGNHQLGGVIMANGGVKDIGGQVQYINSTNRLNWGGTVGHIPLAFGFLRRGSGTGTEGETEVQQVIRRIFIDQAALSTSYPLSQTRRFELGGGLTRYSYDEEVYSAFIDRIGRQLTPFERIDDESNLPDPVNLAETSLAYVGDNSFFGFTSPVAGERFRFEVSPTFGTLQFQTVLADYRRYMLVQPVTFAFRAMHFGRYGQDSHGLRDGSAANCQQQGLANCQSEVLTPLNLGWQGFVRGYSTGSISDNIVTECESTTQCSVFDRLRGSRIALASFEVRIPLFGTEQLGLLNFPFLPTEIVPFIDAGAAWSSSNDPRPNLATPLELKFSTDTNERVPVFSAGIAARFNILGYMVLESYYAYPFQRPDKGWDLGFQVLPGW